MTEAHTPYGLAARFDGAAALATAAQRVREAGYAHVDAYAPVPLPEVEQALGLRSHAVIHIAVIAGVLSALGAYALQYYAAVVDYPFVVGGKPLHSWPPFLVVGFAAGLLGAVVATGLSLLLLNGFPEPYHPMFNVEAFADGSTDGYFLCIAASDPHFDLEETRALVDGLAPVAVHEVPP